MINTIKKYWLLICILILALGMRMYQLGTVPGAIYWEEAALGYDAYSILKTGRDFHSNMLPTVSFVSFGDYKPSLYFYAIVPFIKLFGLTDIAVRMPSVLSGVFTVFIVYLLSKKLFSEKIGLLAAFLYAMQPWSMHVSRVGFETNLATCLLSLGILLIVYAKEKHYLLILSAISFALSMYTYHSTRIIAPIIALTFFVLYFMNEKRKTTKIVLPIFLSVSLALILVFPILLNIKDPSVMHRAAETSIFTDIAPINESNRLKELSGNTLISKIIYHRYVLFGEMIFKNYAKNFSFDFLFLSGDENIRHQTKEFGVLYHWELFSLLSFLFVLLRKRNKNMWLLVLWVMVAAIPPSITTVVPHTLRFLSASPAIAMMSAIGLLAIYEGGKRFSKKIAFIQPLFLIVIVGIICIDACVYVHYYFVHYRSISSRDFQYGYAQVFEKLESIKKNDQKIVVTREQGRPSIYYMFYRKLDPTWVQEQEKVVKKDQGELLELGQYTFSNVVPNEKGILVASSKEKVLPGATILDSIYLPNGELMWVIWEK